MKMRVSALVTTWVIMRWTSSGEIIRKLSDWEQLTPTLKECQIKVCENVTLEEEIYSCTSRTPSTCRYRAEFTLNGFLESDAICWEYYAKTLHGYFPPPFYPMPPNWRLDTSIIPSTIPQSLEIRISHAYRMAFTVADHRRRCGRRPNLGWVWKSTHVPGHHNFSINAFHRFLTNEPMVFILPPTEIDFNTTLIYNNHRRNATIFGTKNN